MTGAFWAGFAFGVCFLGLMFWASYLSLTPKK